MTMEAVRVPPLLGGGLSLIDGVSPVSGASRVARSRLTREGALIFYWDLGGYRRIYIYIMLCSGRFVVGW